MPRTAKTDKLSNLKNAVEIEDFEQQFLTINSF